MENIEELHKVMNTAVAAIKEIYKGENLKDVEVEEVERGMVSPGIPSGEWLVTVGFTRQKPRITLGGLALPERTLKVVTIDPDTNEFKGMKIRNPNT